MQSITCAARAKINLTLDVLGKRTDGYHTVRMVMQTIDLHDDVTATLTDGGVTLASNLPYLPVDSRNLAVRAAHLFFETLGVTGRGVHLELKKRIPVAAGLAGGSTDAAAVLRALDMLCGTNLGTIQLCNIGVGLGADVPYCLCGGTMLAEGFGETLTALPGMPSCYVVLVKPRFGVSTAAAYKRIDSCPPTARPDTDGLIAALTVGDYEGVCSRLRNVMEDVLEDEDRAREITFIKRLLLSGGADGTCMSGSGPTVYGLFSDKKRALHVYKAVRKRYADTFVTEIFR